MQIRISYHRLFLAAALLSLIFVSLGCSTKKNTFSRRVYHNITSRYNVYFNGRESLNEGSIELVKGVKDTYNEVLPVFNFGTKLEAQQLNPQMDRAIQKASITIQKHSMPFGGTEKVRWIDDAYLLIGKAYFYKQEYFSARRTFNFIIQEYGYDLIRYDAMIWLALTYHQTGEFEKSEPLLNLITNDISNGIVPKNIISILPQVYADLYIRQGKYDQAVEFLNEAIAFKPKRDLKTRMMFILAQVYQQNGDLNRASDWYTKVIKRRPVYDMAFQAKINLARSYDASSGNRAMVTKILNKMLKDEKNKDYRDQIYFAMADVALRDRDTANAIEYLRLSVSTSVNNNFQRSNSALTLADLYFEIPSYMNAQAYYDTALMALPKEYPDYDVISGKTRVLTSLVKSLITIQHEDSLQRLVNMTEPERNAVIDKLIKAYQEEQQRLAEERQLEAELARQQQATSLTGTSMAPAAPIGGKWYFYNMQVKEFGQAEFVRKWGQRRYEDLWRISDKQTIAFGYDQADEMTSDTTLSDSLALTANNPQSREYYLKNLPFTEEAMLASNTKILNAYFDAGKIYKDGLRNNPKSQEAFVILNRRFPESEYELQSYYYLYKIFMEEDRINEADYYKNVILQRYPDSDYAKLLTDPDYFIKLAAEKNRVNVLYEDTYNTYKKGQYYQVIAKADMALAQYGDSIPLAPKFEYLKAMSIGKVDVLDSLVSSLKRIIIKYPNSEIKTLSQSMLAHIIQDNPEMADENFVLPGVEVEVEKPSPYKFNASGQHMFMIVVDSREIRLNPFKVKMSDYNIKYYSLEKLNINSLVLDNQHYLVTVGNFNNSAKAMDYLDAIVLSDYIYADLKKGTFYNFVISTENYPIFFKEKDIGEYEKFFKKHYQQ